MVFYTSLFLLFLVPCFSFSHLSVFLGVGSSIHVAAWGNQLSVKLLPPLCRKARRAVVAASFCFSWGPKGRRGAVPAVHSGGSSVGNTWEGEGLHCLYLSLEPCAHDLSAGYGKCWLLAGIMQGSANCNAHLGKYRGGKVERGPARPFLQCLYELGGNQFLLMWAFRES